MPSRRFLNIFLPDGQMGGLVRLSRLQWGLLKEWLLPMFDRLSHGALAFQTSISGALNIWFFRWIFKSHFLIMWFAMWVHVQRIFRANSIQNSRIGTCQELLVGWSSEHQVIVGCALKQLRPRPWEAIWRSLNLKLSGRWNNREAWSIFETLLLAMAHFCFLLQITKFTLVFKTASVRRLLGGRAQLHRLRATWELSDRILLLGAWRTSLALCGRTISKGDVLVTTLGVAGNFPLLLVVHLVPFELIQWHNIK